MKNISKSYISILFFIVVNLGFQSNCMQAPTPKLSDVNFKAASVLPYTRWKKKSKGGNPWFLLSKESGGKNKGTYDGGSGKKDHGETHPVITASRELSEETLGILGNARALKNHIDVSSGNTLYVIHRSSKRYVTYITKFPHADLEKFAREFYQLPTRRRGEKNSLRWVKWTDLEKMIQQSIPGQKAYIVKAAKVDRRTGKILKDAQGKHVTDFIHIRPVVVTMLRPLFQNHPYIPGRNHKIRFYS